MARPNGANAGITTILLNQKSDVGTGGDGTSYCVDFVRSSRSKGTAPGEANLTGPFGEVIANDIVPPARAAA